MDESVERFQGPEVTEETVTSGLDTDVIAYISYSCLQNLHKTKPAEDLASRHPSRDGGKTHESPPLVKVQLMAVRR